MIHDILRRTMKKTARWMQIYVTTALCQRAVALLWIALGCIAEISRANSASHATIIRSTRQYIMMIAVHNSDKLLSHILCTTQSAALNKIVHAPRHGKAARDPSIVHSQKCKMVTFGLEKLRSLSICLCLFILRPVEYIRNAEHGNDTKHFLTTAHIHARNQHFCHGWVHRKVCHFATKSCKESFIVKS